MNRSGHKKRLARSGAGGSLNPHQRALARAAGTLKQSIMLCGRPNRAKDQPIPEQNLVLHLAAALLGQGYAVYGEADLPRAGRIDLVACNEKVGLVVEAATFGSINMAKLLRDARRLEQYRPQCPWRLKSKRHSTEFWRCLTKRWAMIAVLCFSWEHLATCWDSLLDGSQLEEALSAKDVSDIRAFGSGRREAMRELGRFLRRREAEIDVLPVLRDFWVASGARDVMPLWIFSAAWRLDA